MKKGVFNMEKCKICIPIIEKTKESIIEVVRKIENTEADMIEWRVDYFNDILMLEKVIEVLKLIRLETSKTLLFTYRSKREGGMGTLTTSEYLVLLKSVCLSKQIDMIDIEFMTGDAVIDSIIKHSKLNGVKIVLSNHDFENTPRAEIMENRMRLMSSKNVDIVKGAYMPKTQEDVDTVLSVCAKLKGLETEYVLISMGELGVQTRVDANKLGCAFTFATIDKASAPGQIEITKLLEMWNK